MIRLKKFIELLNEQHLEGFLITSRTDIRYLSGFTGSAGMLWVSPEKNVFITDFRYKTQAKKQVGESAEIFITSPEKAYFDILEELEVFKEKRFVGFDSVATSYSSYRRLTARFLGNNFIPVDNPLTEIRQVKEPEEITKIEGAAQIAIEALAEVLPLLRPGITEKEFSTELEYHLNRKGSEKSAFDIIVASGKNAALPHAKASEKVIETGDMVTIDFGAIYEGYASDITRTYFIGTPDDKFKKIYELVLQAQSAAIKGAKAGLTGKEIDAIARKVIEDAGYGEYFGHGLGHGIGLVVHDAPTLNKRGEKVVPENSVVTIEPGIYIPEWGGIRIEDDFVVETDGVRCITSELPKNLIDIIIPVG